MRESLDGRVLLDARPLQSAHGQRGIGSYVRGLITGLIEEGFDDRCALLFEAQRTLPPVPLSRLVACALSQRYGGRMGLIEEAAIMGGRLAQLGPAVYHATSLKLPGRCPVPVVATLHDLIPWAAGGWRMLGERSRWWLGRRLLRQADLVIAPSKATAADARRLADISDDRLVIIPEGVARGFAPAEGAHERVRIRYGLDKPYLIFVGALDARKDPKALLRAWEVARRAGADVELLVAGAASRQAPPTLGDARRLGYVDHADLVDLYSAATCMLFPSRYEGFGLTILEAMACGCPVVSYDNSSLPEVAGDAALLVSDGDADAMGRTAAEIALDPTRAAQLGQAGIARARQFTWRKAARATMAAYQRFLE